ncbi:MAG: TRAP transporter small permease subunit [Rhizobiaceae bacterium]|nr:TRAP transporter small permease subunit [Rhizobiaceae bacterium]
MTGPDILVAVYRAAHALAAMLRTVAAVCIAVMVTITMVEVLSRNIFAISIPWASELTRTLFVWSVLLGISVTTWTKSHIAVTALREIGGKALVGFTHFAAAAALVTLAVILLVQGVDFAAINFSNITPALRLSLAIPTGAVAVGGLCMALFGTLTYLEEILPSARAAGSMARTGSAS